MKETENVKMSSTSSAVVAKTSSSPSDHPACDYAMRVLKNFNLLRSSAHLCDVKIVSGVNTDDAKPKVFYAHRTILAASSPYFNAMFTGGLVEMNRQQIVIQSMSERALESILNFIYRGDVKITKDNVQELMIAGDMIGLQELVETCTRYFLKELEPSNAIGIFRFASDHNCLQLKEASETFIHEHFVEISKGEEFHDIPRDLLAEFVMSEYLRVDSEYQVFQSALSWIESDISSRRRHIFDILKFIRLPLVPCKLIETYVQECRDISLKVALNSIRKDLASRKGSLVTLNAYPRLSAKKNIYVIGGSQRELRSAWTKTECTYHTVEVYDTFKSEWHQASPMKIGRILPGIAVMGGLIYVCGGEVESQILANGEVYDPNENCWSDMASMTIPRCEFGMCALNNFLYAFGGWVGEDIGGSIERYDPTVDQWTMIAKMPEPRFSMGIVTYDGLIYLVGGCTHSRRHMQELVSYNPTTAEWNTHASMLVPRSQMGCVVLDDHLYVVGGTNRHNEVLQSVECYSFKDNAWKFIPPMHDPHASPACCSANGKIYVFGGDQIHEVNFYRARTTFSAAECFDPLTNTWSKSVPLPESRSEAGAVVI